MAASTAVFLSCILLLFGQYVYLLFSNDPAVISRGMEIMQTLVPFYFTYICVEVLAGAARGTGDALFPTIITCVGICVLRVVWIFTVVPFYHDLKIVIISYPLTWGITSILFIIYYLQGGWLRRRIKKAGFEPEGSLKQSTPEN
jgi:Na+-driven multidrug efflux pump